MDRISPRTLCGGDDGGDVQIALTRGGAADVDGFISHLHVLRRFVRVREYRDAPQPHAACGADDAAGDLAAIGDQQVLEHGCPLHPEHAEACLFHGCIARNRE